MGCIGGVVAPIKQVAVSSSEEGDSLDHATLGVLNVEPAIAAAEQQSLQQQQSQQLQQHVQPISALQNSMEASLTSSSGPTSSSSSDWFRSSWKSAWTTMTSALVRQVNVPMGDVASLFPY